MKARCYTVTCKEYPQWGGRGIKICDIWKDDYTAFKQWSLANGFDYTKQGHSLSIDRIDVDGDYCPENCRWVSALVQANNKTNNIVIEVNNETLTLSQCARKYAIPYARLVVRHKSGVRGNDLIAPKYTRFKKSLQQKH